MEKLNQYLNNPEILCTLSVTSTFVDTIKGTLCVSSLSNSTGFRIAAEAASLSDVLIGLSKMLVEREQYLPLP